jgi:amidase
VQSTSPASRAGARIHAFADDALGGRDGVALARLVAGGAVHPDELVAAARERAAVVADRLGAVAHQAAQPRRLPDPGSELDAVPTYAKDNLDIAGMPTTFGTAAFVAEPARSDGSYARQFLGTGMAVLGKSRMPEFGLNASTEFAGGPPARNPWDPQRSVGGSSGGSAALVAAGVVPLAHANDGGGSIRIPAAAAGLVGLKPTRGRHVDSPQARSLPVKLISEGVVSRSVRDTAAFVHAMERRWRNPTLPPVGRVLGASSRRLRIGVLDATIGPAELDTATRGALDDTAKLLEANGHRIEPVGMPVDERFAVDFLHYWGLLSFLISVTGKKVFDPAFDPTRMDALSVGLRRHARRRLLEMPVVLARLRHAGRRCAVLFAEHDVVLSPVMAQRAPRLGYLSPEVGYDTLIVRLVRQVAVTPLHNVAGFPAIAVPGPLDDGGLPTSTMLAATWGDERTLLELAFELEEARPFPRIQDRVAADRP